MNAQTVTTASELVRASEDAEISLIEVAADLSGVPAITLRPGQTLRSLGDHRYTLAFIADADGLQLTSDHVISNLALHTSAHKRAIWNDDSSPSLGSITLHNLRTIGQVQLLARNQVRSGNVVVDGLDIVAADTRTALDRPYAYGVSVLQGAFTLWNMQAEETVTLSANVKGLSAGRSNAPVLGSGIFLSGFGDRGGRLLVERLETEAVYSNGMIAEGTPNLISGGVFTVYGAVVDLVRNCGPVTTYGPNDMALDNWGTVDRWVALEKITTYGPSGIGFVNFGTLGLLRVEAPIETFGRGARGFNVYSGTVASGDFDRIVTHGDGAVGVQIAQPVGVLIFRRGIETFGATGPSLVKGVVQQLSAIALSIKAGGIAQRISVTGGLTTHGKDTHPLEQLGSIASFEVSGGFTMLASSS